MDKIRKEQIDNVIEKIMNEIDICNEYAESIERFQEALDKDEYKEIQGGSLYLATFSTAIGLSVRIIREALYELLCDEVVE